MLVKPTLARLFVLIFVVILIVGRWRGYNDTMIMIAMLMPPLLMAMMRAANECIFGVTQTTKTTTHVTGTHNFQLEWQRCIASQLWHSIASSGVLQKPEHVATLMYTVTHIYRLVNLMKHFVSSRFFSPGGEASPAVWARESKLPGRVVYCANFNMLFVSYS